MMNKDNIEKTRLRDLVLQFYTIHDPQRLQDGIDINGMVTWAMEKGIPTLNAMLMKTYGEGIDLNDTSELNSAAHINRVSMAVSGRPVLNMHEMKKIRIAEQLKKFYKRHDPSKLQSIFKLTEYALYKGENALNHKLRQKYGEDLRSLDKEDSVDSHSTTSHITELIPPLGAVILGNNNIKANINTDPEYHEIIGTEVMPVEEPESPDSPEEVIIKKPSVIFSDISDSPEKENLDTEGTEAELGTVENNLNVDKEKLEAELLRFYKHHDPDKVMVLEALVIWALQLGRHGYNEKLTQLYGADLDTPIEGDKAQKKPGLTKAEEKRINKPITTKKNLIQRITEAEKPSFLSFEMAAKAGVKKADPLQGPKTYREHMPGEGEVCDSYKLDMTSKFFGVCKTCGFPKRVHY